MIILVINCGSTSTKFAVYEEEKELCTKVIRHDPGELEKCGDQKEQVELRYEAACAFLKEAGVKSESLTCIVSRGGLLPSVESGAYCINENMIKVFENPLMPNANASQAGMVANRLSSELQIPAFIYDAVSVDELEPVARYSGVKGEPRYSVHHALNTRSRALEVAKELGKEYSECNLIVAHMGGGFSVNIHLKGRIVDVISAEEGSFSPERCGGLQGDTVLKLAEEKGISETRRLFHGTGGLVSYFQTNDIREVEKMADDGNKEAALVMDAMAYQTAKSIGALATVAEGKIDRIILTGGGARSERLTAAITRRVEFLAPVVLKPGENEMRTLAEGALRVMRGQEHAKCYEFKR